jgi:hypothetical protein
VVVAFAGMLAVLASASYLRELAHRPPEQLPAPVLATSHAGDPLAHLQPEVPPVTVVNGRGAPVVMKIGSTVYRFKLEPVAPAAP